MIPPQKRRGRGGFQANFTTPPNPSNSEAKRLLFGVEVLNNLHCNSLRHTLATDLSLVSRVLNRIPLNNKRLRRKASHNLLTLFRRQLVGANLDTSRGKFHRFFSITPGNLQLLFRKTLDCFLNRDFLIVPTRNRLTTQYR